MAALRRGEQLNKRSPLIAGALLAVLLAMALLLLTPSFLVLVLFHDAAAPAEITSALPAAKEQLNRTRGFRWPAGYYRFVSLETRTSDNLVVLYFEYRAYPFITATSACAQGLRIPALRAEVSARLAESSRPRPLLPNDASLSPLALSTS